MSTPPSFSLASLLVFAGGGFGAWLRFLTARAWAQFAGFTLTGAFPWATLTANVLGSLAMGLLAGWLGLRGISAGGWSGEHWRLLLGVGVLGGYTTFSSLALEFGLFFERGALGLAALYVGISLVAGFAALFAGLALARSLA